MKRRYMIPLLILVVLGIAYWAATSYGIEYGPTGSTGWNRPYQ